MKPDYNYRQTVREDYKRAYLAGWNDALQEKRADMMDLVVDWPAMRE